MSRKDLSFEQLSPVQRAAILMMLVGEETAAHVLKAMSPSEVEELGAAMYTVRGVSHETVDAVLDEFFDMLRDQTDIGYGANAYVRNVLNNALGSYKAQSVLSRIKPASSERPIEILDWMDAPAIAELILDEHPQIISLIVASLDFSQAADVLKLLPEDLQPEIVQRVANLTTVQPEALRELEEVMQRKFKANTTLRASQIGGVKAAAKIMNFTRQNMEQRILKEIKKDDKDLMEALQDNMFVFENLIKSDDRALQTLLRGIEQEILVMALKGADGALRSKLLGCMSTRAAANIMDEMDSLGPVRLTAVQQAQKEVISVARRLADEGTITLAGRGGEKMV
ncbi:flagellar motor switch protein FliG [Pseudoprimorskyibacter insulae]|nr:flagellar motor switch protein FliG [Pseudoprimorskyibacter insulae]